MADRFVPHICGENDIYLPDRECTDCEKLEKRLSDLEEAFAQFVQEVHENYYTKAEVNELIASVSGGGGFKLVEELPEEGESGFIYLVPKPAPDTGYEQYVWTDSGWVDLGEESITLDKESILTALGYRETTITMTDTNDNTITRNILVEIA